MKIGVVVYPGSNCDSDAYHAFKDVMGVSVRYVWYEDSSFGGVDLVVLPGGFSYGDYLRCGAIAEYAPVASAIREHAKKGKYIIGICNGFQILTEMNLLPGALIRNVGLKFICDDVYLKVENKTSVFTKLIDKDIIKVPIAHGEGNFRIEADGLKELYDNNQVIFKYSSKAGDVSEKYNPNGSIDNIAGICNKEKNILGMMPHPERVCESIIGGIDGKKILESVLSAIA
jgi:phosphoribosylformylglycinamidine synthase